MNPNFTGLAQPRRFFQRSASFSIFGRKNDQNVVFYFRFSRFVHPCLHYLSAGRWNCFQNRCAVDSP